MPPDNGWAADRSLTRAGRLSRIRDAGLACQVIRSPSFIRAPPCNVLPSISEHYSRTNGRIWTPAITGAERTARRQIDVGARSPGPCPSLSVTLAIGITSRSTFDPAPVGHTGAGVRYAGR